MALDRKGIRTALFDHLKTQLAGKVTTFQLQDITGPNIPQGSFPLLVLRAEASDVGSSEALAPPDHRLRFSVVLYDRGDANEADPDASLDDLVAAVEFALERKDGETLGSWWTTLGGKVQRAYPTGADCDAGGPGEVKIGVVGVELVCWPPDPGAAPT